MKKYNGYRPAVYTDKHREIDNYVNAIPFEVRRESLFDREMAYIGFKNWMFSDLGIDGGEVYDYGIQRVCWKLWI